MEIVGKAKGAKDKQEGKGGRQAKEAQGPTWSHPSLPRALEARGTGQKKDTDKENASEAALDN